MLKEPGAHQHALEMVTLESLVPEDHLLRHIDAFIDFEFIRDKVRHLYCIDNGRPATDIVVASHYCHISGVTLPSAFGLLINRTLAVCIAADQRISTCLA